MEKLFIKKAAYWQPVCIILCFNGEIVRQSNLKRTPFGYESVVKALYRLSLLSAVCQNLVQCG